MKMLMKKLRKNEGFTLVEMIVVIAIIGILAAVAVPVYSGYITKANATADTQVCSAVLTAAQAALAQDGTVEKVVITLGGEDGEDKITATSENGEIILRGSGADATYKSDFDMFFGANELPKSFKTITDNGAANKATWTEAASVWQYEYVS